MAGKFSLKKFSDINLNDPFFDSLKNDYPGTANSTGFTDWFKKKSVNGATALVFEDEIGIGAFVALKAEYEEIKTQTGALSAENRMKVSTLKISERHRGERHGEGAIGLMLWKWQLSGFNQIYVTVFDKQKPLIAQLERFGFRKIDYNLNGEGIYIKDKRTLDFSNPYLAFPFIKSGFDYAGYLIIEDTYHDTMFAYSELANNRLDLQDKIGNSVSNGLSKIYVGRAPVQNHKVGEPIFIYRKDTAGRSGTKYRSCITSYAVVTNVIQAKSRGRYRMSFDDLIKRIGNKSVFDEEELQRQYTEYYNVSIVELLYYGYFGAGNNVPMNWLNNNNCWVTTENYPTEIHLSEIQFKRVLAEGKVNVSNVIVN